MRVAYIRWLDACAEEAADTTPRPAKPELSELHEVGFLLAETEDAVQIGMEQQGDDTRPGRWRLSIPRVSIQEMRVVDLDLFAKKRRARGR